MIWLCMIILLACSIAGFWLAFREARQQGEFLNFSTLLLLCYTLVQPISGLVHLADIEGAVRGYFDLLKGDPYPAVMATICAVAGLAALALGGYYGGRIKGPHARPIPRTFWLNGVETFMLVGLIFILGPITLYCLKQIVSFVSSTGMERTIQVDGGMARFFYLAQWLVWVISIGALLIAGRQRSLGQFGTALILGIAVLMIASVLRFTGGRSIIVVMALPIIIALLPRYRQLKRSSLLIGAIALLTYTMVLSQIRSDALKSGAGVNLAGWFDWEGGRFSMTGFAVQYVENYGYVYGETLLNAVTWTFNGLFQFFGIQHANVLRSSSEIAGSVLIARVGGIYVVPGMSAELFMNFGLLGIVAGYLGLGWLVRRIDRRIALAPSVLARLALAFLGTLAVFRTIPADSSALPSFVIYLGFPLLSVWCASSLMRLAVPMRLPTRANRRALPLRNRQG
jgi:oligosaccharide repeat unit polymerase